jgi:RNA polymerase sigma-70 factor (ECF subfamily)
MREATPSCPHVNPKRVSDGDAASATTLGELLYADGVAPTPEDSWVGLVRAIGTGDQVALRALYERTHRIVFTLAARICGRRELAEEVTVDVFHEIWRRAPHYDGSDGTVIGWLMIQTRSRAIDRMRFEQRKKRVAPQPDGQEPIAIGSPADMLDARQRRNLLQHALCELTPDERTAIETAFFSELSYSETAQRLDQPLGTVKTRVRSALAKLRRALDAVGESS